MRVPNSLESLTDMGIIQEVLRPLMSGKEAEVYLVLSGGEERVAKVYKEAQNRSFRQRAEYTEGRSVRNTRDQRAMAKRTRYGRSQDEAAWRSTEVDMIYRLRNAGVRVPTPHHFIDGVLIMELVKDADGNPAPRLGELALDRNHALEVFDRLIAETVRMLSAGVVHGDFSEFNVLMGADGPVVIDFPQAVNASSNQNARQLLIRDVDNLHRFVARCVPGWQARPLAHEMWELYRRNQLFPDTRLNGRYRQSEQRTNTDAVMGLIADANRDERRRREGLGLGPRGANAGTPKPPPSTTPTEDALAAVSNAGFRPRRVEVVMAPPAARGGGAPRRDRVADEMTFDASRQGGGQRTNAWARPSNQGQRNSPPHSQSQGGMRGQGPARPQPMNPTGMPSHSGRPRPAGNPNAPHGQPNRNNSSQPIRRDGQHTPSLHGSPRPMDRPPHASTSQPAHGRANNSNGAPSAMGTETRSADSPAGSQRRRRRRKRRGPGTPT